MSVYATLISDRSLCSRSISLSYRSIDLDSRGITSDRMQIQVGCVHIENIHSNRFDKVEFQYFPGFGNQIQLLHMYNYYVCTLFRKSIITQKKIIQIFGAFTGQKLVLGWVDFKKNLDIQSSFVKIYFFGKIWNFNIVGFDQMANC